MRLLNRFSGSRMESGRLSGDFVAGGGLREDLSAGLGVDLGGGGLGGDFEGVDDGEDLKVLCDSKRTLFGSGEESDCDVGLVGRFMKEIRLGVDHRFASAGNGSDGAEEKSMMMRFYGS